MTTFGPDQIAALQAPLSAEHVKQRSQAGRTLDYVEGWHAIAEANRIFGFDAWNRETLEIRCVAEKARKIGREPNTKDGWGVTYVAKVRITVGDIVREGVGAGSGIDVDLGLAHESAIKEAETDAMKRALVTFGNPFGLALYDKQQKEVDRAPPAAKTPAPKPAAVAPTPPRLIEVPLLPDGSGPNWKAWCTDLAGAIKVAPTIRDVDGWMKANEAPLGNCEEQAPKLFEAIRQRARERLAYLKDAPHERAA